MSDMMISADTESAREQARNPDGTFGNQAAHAEPGAVSLDAAPATPQVDIVVVPPDQHDGENYYWETSVGQQTRSGECATEFDAKTAAEDAAHDMAPPAIPDYEELDEDTFDDRFGFVNDPEDGSSLWDYSLGVPSDRDPSIAPDRVWTAVDGDDGRMYVVPGVHLVNRVSYYVTEKPWPHANVTGVFDEAEDDDFWNEEGEDL